MADEPSWDEIFAGHRPSQPQQPAAPLSRRELRARERAAERADADTEAGTAAEPSTTDSADQGAGSPTPTTQLPAQAPQSPTPAARPEQPPTPTAAQPVQPAQPAAPQPAHPAAAQPAAAQSDPSNDIFALANAVTRADPAASTPAGAPANPTTAFSTTAATSGAGETATADTRPTATAAAAAPGKPPKQPRQKRSGGRRRPRRGTWILIAVLVVILGGGAAVVSTLYNQYAPGISALFGAKPSDDYTGSGNGTKVQFTIVSGDIGSTIADKLAKADITKSSSAPYKLLLADTTIQFIPGTYTMYEHMSAQSAITRLQDSSARVTNKLVIPEGTTLKGIISLMASATKISTADVTAAAADYKSYGLPSTATSLEGYLFPATYDLQPGNTAKQYFQLMVDTMKKHLAAAGVAPADYEHEIIFASLIQKEAGLAADYPKVARVFQNRIDDDMLLQSDATVAYGAGTTGRVTTTDAERADASNKYNTYVHKGLPVGPISNPGDLALDAASHPATGSWVYFVTVNLETGETVFSTTYAEHQKAVAQFQSWLRAHPEYDK